MLSLLLALLYVGLVLVVFVCLWRFANKRSSHPASDEAKSAAVPDAASQLASSEHSHHVSNDLPD